MSTDELVESTQRAKSEDGEALYPEDSSVLGTLQEDFESFGLSGYESRVLLAVLQIGAATPSQIADLAGVPRTSVYSILDGLGEKGLTEPVPGKSVAWASPGRGEVMTRLHDIHAQRWKALNARMDRAAELLEELGPEGSSRAVPGLRVLRNAEDVKAAYERLLGAAQDEVAMFNRPPYTWAPGKINTVIADTLARGVRIRVLYQSPQLADASEDFSAAHEDYHRAGVEGRAVEQLPMKLAIADNRLILLSVTDATVAPLSFPTSLLLESPGFAKMMVLAFDQLWAHSRPYADVAPAAGSRRPSQHEATDKPAALSS